jgi:hypothetical protein
MLITLGHNFDVVVFHVFLDIMQTKNSPFLSSQKNLSSFREKKLSPF